MPEVFSSYFFSPVFAVTVAIVSGYAFSLWWFLRRESAQTLLWLAVICSLALSIRLVDSGHQPEGLWEDESRFLASATQQLRFGNLLGREPTGGPALLIAVFQSQLVPLFGVGRWTIRTYSLLTSVLSCAAGFAAARAMGLRVAPGLGVAGLLAVLPWSVFWGRISMGGELPFHQLLLIAATARVIWGNGGWVETLIGGFGLTLLLYDYWAGRAMLAMPFIGFALAKGRGRFACLAMLVVGVLGLSVQAGSDIVGSFTAILVDRFDPSYAVGNPIEVLFARLLRAARVLVAAAGRFDAQLTAPAAGIHPPWLLAVALLGSFTGLRRSLCLWGGFLAGVAPEVLSASALPSVHRLMMCFPFVALGAGAALDLLPIRRLRAAGVAVVVLVAGVQSAALFFSDRFWTKELKEGLESSASAAVASLPDVHPPAYFSRSCDVHLAARGLIDRNVGILRLETWYPPPGPSIYLFTDQERILRPYYEDILGPDRVKVYGSAFVVHLENRDWNWMRESGWTQIVHCSGNTVRTRVPAIYTMSLQPSHCAKPSATVWLGKWTGPAARLRLHFSGSVRIELGGSGPVTASGYEEDVEFDVLPDSEVRVYLDYGTQNILAELTEKTEAGYRIPPWGHVTPISDMPAP